MSKGNGARARPAIAPLPETIRRLTADAGGVTMRIVPPLAPGRYRLVIDPRLEDLAGNSVARPFNIDLTKAGDSSGTEPPSVELGFEVPSSDSE